MGEAGAAESVAWDLNGLTGLAGLEAAARAVDLSRYLASRIARMAASLLIVQSHEEL